MQASKRRIPHFTYVEEVDVTAVERAAGASSTTRAPSSRSSRCCPSSCCAVVLAVRDHPEMNARFDDEATASSTATAPSISASPCRPTRADGAGRQGRRRASTSGRARPRSPASSEAARDAKITLEELSGSTITITSLGALGGIVSTPVINAPEVAIIGVNKIVDPPRVRRRRARRRGR